MQKLHTYVFDRVLKSIALPIVIVEIIFIIFIICIGYYQDQSNQNLMLEQSRNSFQTLTMQFAKRMAQEFANVEKDTRAIKRVVEESFNTQKICVDRGLKYSYDSGFYYVKNTKRASVYTTNIVNLQTDDKRNMELLYLAIPTIDAVIKEYGSKVEATWINIGSKYSLYYPKIDMKRELSPTLDSTKQHYYFKADEKHNPKRKTIFIPLFNEPWALSHGQIGAVVSPIYVKNKMIGVVGVSLTTKSTQKLSEIELPFNAYVMITDNEGYILFSSDENRSYKDFSISSFTQLYKEGRKGPLKKFKNIATNSKDYMLHKHKISNTGLNLYLVARKSEVNKDITAVFKRAREIAIAVLFFIGLLHIYLYRKLKFHTIKITDELSRPVIQIARASSKLFKEGKLGFNKSDIQELNLLNRNLEKAHNKLINMLYIDAATSLPNQKKLLLDIENSDSLVLISVDNLKNINNIYGPDIGEEVLLMLVEQLKEIYRSDSKIYRVYSDLFALLVKLDKDINGDIYLVKQYKKLRGINIVKDGISIVLNYSLSLAKASSSSEFSLFARAEIALDKLQKQAHLNYLVFDEQKHIKEYTENIKWAKKVQDAFDTGNLVAFLQPIYDIKQDRVYKFEALIRLLDGDEVVSPSKFLGAAASMGKVSDITRLMLKQVFETAVKYKDVEFSINISFEDFEQANLLPEIENLMKDYDLNACNIIFELLETGILKDEKKIIQTIGELKLLGCKIAIDDFGTGNSNFAHLMLMQVDYIKIDGQFIKNINSDLKSLNITRTIRDFTIMTGAKTIAEFVYQESVFKKVKELDIDFAQGYYISEPRPISQIDEMLKIRVK